MLPDVTNFTVDADINNKTWTGTKRKQARRRRKSRRRRRRGTRRRNKNIINASENPYRFPLSASAYLFSLNEPHM